MARKSKIDKRVRSDNEDELLRALVTGYPNGRTAKQLHETTGLDWKTIADRCGQLRRKGLVSLERIGRRHTYYAKPAAIEEAEVFSWLVADRIIRSLKLQVPDSAIAKLKSTQNPLEQRVQQFAAGIGAIIVFLLTKTMAPSGPASQVQERFGQQGEVVDKIIARWWDYILPSGDIINVFRETLPFPMPMDAVDILALQLFSSSKKTTVSPDAVPSRLSLSREQTAELERTFSRLFPSMARQFEVIYREISDELKHDKEIGVLRPMTK